MTLMTDVQTETILVADDSPATRYSTVRVLKNAGFKVIEASTGGEALQLAQKGCDLVVLDVNLPDMNGHDVCRKIRQEPATSRVPVIHLSASFISDDSKIRGLESGADGYLTHPVDPLVLVATIRAFLRTRQIENALLRSEAKFRAIFDRAMTGICLLSQDLIFLDVNPTMCRLLRISPEQIVGKHGSAFVDSTHEAKIVEISRELEQVGTWSGSLPLLRSDGQPVHLDWHVSLHSEPSIRLAIVSDVTERQQLDAEREHFLTSERAARVAAEKANRLKDEFLATLSHELRTPLNAIIGWTQVLQFRPPSATDLAEGLAIIERNAKIQAELINDLLDVSRIMSGKLRLNIQPIDPAVMVRDAMASVMPAAQAKGVKIDLSLDSAGGSILGDAARLQQVIWNVVNNAVKFTPRDGSVHVAMQRRKDDLDIRISDTGQGIKPEFLPHLFEQFRQEDAGTTRTHGGLGLGLAIVKHLVELHGGTVSAFSEGEGRGTQVLIRLPVFQQEQPESAIPADEAVSEQPSPVAEPAAASLKDVRVLLVEDDRDTRKVAARVLREYDAEVMETESVEQALEVLEHFGPHVLVSDIGMPVHDGYDLIRAIRGRGFDAKRLPAIALTAFARSEDRFKVIAEGYQKHLSKPVTPGELVSAIAALAQQG